MKKITSRNALVIGFLISFIALIFNALFLTDVSKRLQAVEGEHAQLTESLRVQTANGNESETKFQNYRMMYHLANIVPSDKRVDAQQDAAALLNDALVFLYVAANDLPILEIRRRESEQILSEEAEKAFQKIKEGALKTKDIKAEVDSVDLLDTAIEILEKKENSPQEINYEEKIAALAIISDAAANAKDTNEFIARLFPAAKTLNARWVESVQQKQARMAELEKQRRELTSKQSYGTFGALVLQMLGLAFVFLKDFLD